MSTQDAAWANYQNTVSGLSGGTNNASIAAASSRLTNAQQGLYNSVYAPAASKLAGRLDDTTIVDRAKATAGDTYGRTHAREERQMNRYGLQRNQLQNRESFVSNATGLSKHYADTVSNARTEQEDRSQTLSDNMISLGRGVEARASQGIAQSAAAANDRVNAGEAAKAQYKSQKSQQKTQLAGTALMAVAMFM